MDMRNLSRIKAKTEMNKRFGKHSKQKPNSKVINIVNNADECEHLGTIKYSTNPRELITIGDMQLYFQKGWIQ